MLKLALDFECAPTSKVTIVMETFYSISQMASLTGLTEHTLRYYERIGLVQSVLRASSGHRQYSSADLVWVGFLLRLRTIGMPIRQMQQYAALRQQGDGTAAARRGMLETHLDKVRARLQQLRECEQILIGKVAHYAAIEKTMTSSSTITIKRKRHERTLSTGPEKIS